MVGTRTLLKLSRAENVLLDGVFVVSGNPPEWAVSLLKQIAREEGRTDTPHLFWRRQRTRPSKSSSGKTQWSKALKRRVISINQGLDLVDARHVLLHEITHWLVGVKHGHNVTFYTALYHLVNQWSAEHMEHARKRESAYKPTASRAAYAAFTREKAS